MINNYVEYKKLEKDNKNKYKITRLDGDKHIVNTQTGEILDNDELLNAFIQQNNDIENIIKNYEENEKENKSPYSKWAQLNLEYAEELLYLAMKHPNAHGILYFLVSQMDRTNACMVSYKVLTELLGKSRQTVNTAIKTLETMGFIQIFKSGTSNVYTVNHDVYWKSYGKNKKFSKFPANVILSSNEQVDKLKKLLNSDVEDVVLKAVDMKKQK